MPLSFLRREWPRLGLLVLLAALAWMAMTGCWTRTAWTTPASYSVDALETYARFQIAAEQGARFHLAPTVDRLGAPWGADWSAYALPDAWWYSLAGVLVNRLGLVPAGNLMLLLAHVSAVLAFYLCARALRHHMLWAAAGALLFGLSHSLFYRGLSHHSFALALTIPPALLVVWWLGAGRELWRRRRSWLVAGGVAALVGMASPYFVFLFLQLAALAAGYAWWTTRQRRALAAGVGVITVSVMVFGAVNFLPLRATLGFDDGGLQRNYAGTELYGLKPVELLVPPPHHRWPAAAALGRRYADSTQLPGELFASYLGVVGVIAGGWMLAWFVGQLARRRAGLRPGHVPLAAWIVAFAMVGGLNGLIALAGLDHFRAGGRYGIHLLALALFFASGRASRLTRSWSNRTTLLVAGPLVALGLWDQSPRGGPESFLRIQHEADRRAGGELVAALPPRAAVFQLPATPFPEAGPRGGMGDYEHLRLLLGTRDLRFSYGALAGSPPQRWAEWVAQMPPADMIAALQNAGFAALLIDQRAYEQSDADPVEAFQAAGYVVERLESRPELALIRLRPAESATRPDLSAVNLYPAWTPAQVGTHAPVTLHAMGGWFDAEREGGATWRWAGRRAELGLWVAGEESRQVLLSAELRSLAPGRLTLHVNDERWQSWDLDRGAVTLDAQPLLLPAGSSRLIWHFDGALIRPGGERRALGFQLIGLRAQLGP